MPLAFLIGFGALLLAAAAIANGAPLLFPDSFAYLEDGERLVRGLAPHNTRPPFYGAAIWPLHAEQRLWPIVAAQAFAVAHLAWLTLRSIGLGASAAGSLAVIAVLAFATPVGWYVAHVMPDIFAGILVLALFLLGACRDRLSRGETAYLLLLATAATSFHLSHLPLAAIIAVAGLLAHRACPPLRPLVRRDLLLAPTLLAMAMLALPALLQPGATAKSPPFLLARLIADGPGRAYLETTCPSRSFALCRHLDRLPPSAEEFLWYFLAPLEATDHAAIRAEANTVILGTIGMFPAEVARNAALATLRQLISIRSVSEFDPDDVAAIGQRYPYAARSIAGGLQASGDLSEAALLGWNRFHAAAALLMIAVGLRAMLTRRNHDRRATLLVATILLALLFNAAITGAISGVHGRYQGRLIWLLPFAALACAIPRRAPAQPPPGSPHPAPPV